MKRWRLVTFPEAISSAVFHWKILSFFFRKDRGLYKNGEKGNCMCRCELPSVLLDLLHAPHLQ